MVETLMEAMFCGQFSLVSVAGSAARGYSQCYVNFVSTVAFENAAELVAGITLALVVLHRTCVCNLKWLVVPEQWW